MNIYWFQMLGRLSGVVLATGIAACGGGGGVVAPDGGSAAEATRLIILDPPGDSVGLPFAGMVTLGVRYEREDGRPIVGETVTFSVVVGADEDSGGATLSTTTAVTNGAGIATTDLAAGSQRVMFRVAANAPNAPPAFFYIGVSADGFANLVVTPKHQGFRDPTTYQRVELRMYRSTTIRCDQLDIDDLPESTFPPRSADRFDEPLAFANVTVGIGYTLVAWGVGALNELPLAVGCTDLGTAYVPPTRVELSQTVVDRSPVIGRTTLKSHLDLSMAFESQGRTQAWQVLACPRGVGQLVFDCLADVLADDGTLDCVPSVVVAPLDTAIRGPADASGCRPALVGTTRTIDDALTTALLASPGFGESELSDLVVGRKLLAANALVFSEVIATGTKTAVEHVLRHVDFELGTATMTTDLSSANRPIIASPAVPFSVEGNAATIGAHGFTLRPGELLADAMNVLVLAPIGIAGTVHELGTALTAAAVDAPSATAGCTAVSAVVCRHLNASPNCVLTTCEQAATALDARLSAAFTGIPDTGIDLRLSGFGRLYDGDEDLVVDRFGSDKPGAQPGVWMLTVPVTGGPDVDITASFRTP